MWKCLRIFGHLFIPQYFKSSCFMTSSTQRRQHTYTRLAEHIHTFEIHSFMHSFSSFLTHTDTHTHIYMFVKLTFEMSTVHGQISTVPGQQNLFRIYVDVSEKVSKFLRRKMFRSRRAWTLTAEFHRLRYRGQIFFLYCIQHEISSRFITVPS